MRPIGYSTGALARRDYRHGLQMLQAARIPVIELSALRDKELQPLLNDLDSLDLAAFTHISFHAPTDYVARTEAEVSTLLRPLVTRGWPIIVHPDALKTPALWQGFGPSLCIENMDKRKTTGRTAAELEPFFETYPEATFCFDIGHARQIDPTMTEAALFLRHLGHRLREVHMSEVNSRSGHDAISYTALQSFRKLAELIPETVPIVLETGITEDQIGEQVHLARAVFGGR